MAPPRARQLGVFVSGELVGTLGSPGPGRFRFQYEDAIVARADGEIFLSASLPVRAGRYPNALARPFFEGLLPEGAVREAVARSLGISPANGFALLAEIGRECAGAVVIVPSDELLPADDLSEVQWLSDEELAEKIADLPAHPFGVGTDGVRLSAPGQKSCRA